MQLDSGIWGFSGEAQSSRMGQAAQCICSAVCCRAGRAGLGSAWAPLLVFGPSSARNQTRVSNILGTWANFMALYLYILIKT